MTRKLNCWEFRKCGREKGGLMADVLGECPVSTVMKYDGLNDGIGAGRACWIANDFRCRGVGNGPLRVISCQNCEFYKRVIFEQEENVSFRFTSETA
jgi:hypothetical protein